MVESLFRFLGRNRERIITPEPSLPSMEGYSKEESDIHIRGTLNAISLYKVIMKGRSPGREIVTKTLILVNMPENSADETRAERITTDCLNTLTDSNLITTSLNEEILFTTKGVEVATHLFGQYIREEGGKLPRKSAKYIAKNKSK